MGLKALTRLPYANACAVEIRAGEDQVEVRFAPSPDEHEAGPWFHLRLVDNSPEGASPGRIKLVLKHLENLRGVGDAVGLMPVYQQGGHGWQRMKHGQEERSPDGQRHAVWYLRYPEPELDIAFCYPYGMPEVKSLIAKSKGYWHCDGIGISRGARERVRLSNLYEPTGANQAGLCLFARRHPGETPGSWVLDGFLRHFSVSRKTPFLTWAFPLVEVDGIMNGCHWGSSSSAHDMRVIETDVLRWKQRCRPLLALNFRAGEAGETDGVYCRLPGNDAEPPLKADADKWANVFKDALTPGFAAADFKRPAAVNDGLVDLPALRDVCTLALHVPYALVGTTQLTQKDYRQVGKRLAEAVLRRPGKKTR